MHKTAFTIGGLAIQRYGSGPGTRILDIGALDVNGSLKEHIGPHTEYVGIDYDAGPGVDIVVEPGKKLPFKAQSFDLVLASSVFEHDSAFWLTFLEMIRVVRRGGYIYINAPSNGGFHRFPLDNWRFYPDSGIALERWAISQDRPVELIESFICEQDDVNWNDFTAVFRRLPTEAPRPEKFIHTEVPSFNIWSWNASDLIRPQGETQDMLLIAAAQGEAAELREAHASACDELNRANAQIDSAQQQLETAELKANELRAAYDLKITEADQLSGELGAARAAHQADVARLSNELGSAHAAHEAEAQRLSGELAELRSQLHLAESDLRQRYEEIEQYRKELEAAAHLAAQTAADLAAVRAKLVESEAWVAELAKYRANAQKQIAGMEKTLAGSNRLIVEKDQALARQAEAIAQGERQAHRLRAELAKQADELRAELAKQTDELRTELVDRRAREAQLAAQAQEEQQRRLQIEEIANRVDADLQAANRRLETSQDALRQTEASIAEQRAQAVGLEGRLSESQARAIDLDWLRHVHMALASQPLWWRLLPSSWRSARELKLLMANGLFDAQLYLAHYPDVAEQGMNPLRHYIWHGMNEGRQRRFG